MATSPATLVPSTGLDIAGLSVITAAPTSAARAGSIYSPNALAAAQPVWFHQMKDGSYLMPMTRHWTSATPTTTAGLYSAFTESRVPSWTRIAGTANVAMPGAGVIPFRTTVTNPILVGAASYPPTIMWLLHRSDQGAVVQRIEIAPTGSAVNAGEEIVPQTESVVFDLGIQLIKSRFLYLYGADSDAKLYRIRKAWHRIGYNAVDPTKVRVGQASQWEYYTGSSWSSDPTAIAPIQAGLTSAGPLSFAVWGPMTVMSTVSAASTTRTGRIWTQRHGGAWVDSGTAVSLGDTSAGTNLGGGIQLQQQVAANSAGGSSAVIPYLTSQKTTSGSDHSLINTWGVFTMSLVS